jgi:membrane protease YdiL (CAAX protease family)
MQHRSHYITILGRGDTVDFLWSSGLLAIAVIGPFAEEVLFRGTIYVYARQVGGIGFGLVFSSLIFASEHIYSPDNFVLYVVSGIIFATQYEVSQRLAPSIATHTIANFFSYISGLS